MREPQSLTTSASDWRVQMQEALRSYSDLLNFFGEEFLRGFGGGEVARTYSIFIPRPLAERIREAGPLSPLALQFIPSHKEVDPQIQSGGLKDPIGDHVHAQGGQLVHRYQNRALFLPTTVCPVQCRYCFRKNELNQDEELFEGNFAHTLSYLRTHKEIEEVIFSGGDPLILSNHKLQKYFEALTSIPHIRFIRLHTRTPIVLPSRIDAPFVELMREWGKRFERLILVMHTNHIQEIGPDVESALQKLALLPVDLLTQSVILKGVNNSAETLRELCSKLIALKVRPYYLHHPDRALGGMHFSITLEEGKQIYHELRQKIPGWGLPEYVLDSPEGTGKVPAFNIRH